MNDYQKIELAFDVLQNGEVMQEFEDSIWLKIDKADWNALLDIPTDETRSYGPQGAQA